MESFGKSIKFAVIGCGRIGKHHARSIMNNINCDLVAFCDIVPKSELDIDGYQEITFFKNLEELFNSGIEIDVAVIATPNGMHESQAILALDRNLNVVVEKPMALTKIGCERVILKALQKNRRIFCVMQNRYSFPCQWLKQILDRGILGKIYMVQISCFWNRGGSYYKGRSYNNGGKRWHGTKSMDGGTLFTQFSHFIDLLYWYFGDITNICSKFRNYRHLKTTEFEDSGFVIFDFVDGGIGSFHFSTALWNKSMESSIVVIGENGTVKVGGQYVDRIEYCHIDGYTEPNSNSFRGFLDTDINHNYIYKNIVQVLNRSCSITTTALEGMKVVEIIEKMYDEG